MTEERVDLVLSVRRLGATAFRGLRREATSAFNSIKRGARDLRRSVSSIPRALVTVRQSFRGFRESLTRTRVVMLGVSALIAGRFAQRIFQLGAAVGETASKFKTVLGPAVAEMDAFVESFSRMAGLSQREGRDLAATTAAVAQGFGFQGDQAARLARVILRLGGDLASFNNTQGGTAETTAILTRALTGEFDSLKALGIVVRAVEVDQLALATSGKTAAKELTEQERVAARLRLILERAGVANKDLARTQDSAANRGKQLGAQYKDLADTVSVALLPALVALIPVFGQLATAIEPVITKLAKLVETYLAAIGVTNVFAEAEIRAINALDPSRLESHREVLAANIASREQLLANADARLARDNFAQGTNNLARGALADVQRDRITERREALREEVDGLNTALAFLDRRLADLANTADDADRDIADLVDTLGGTGGPGRTFVSAGARGFRRGLAPTRGRGNLTPEQLTRINNLTPPPDPADTRAWQRYRQGLKLVTDELEDGASRLGSLAPTIGALVANIINAGRGEGGTTLGRISGILGGAASVAALLPGPGQAIAAGLATGAIVTGALAGSGRELPVQVRSYGPRAMTQMSDAGGLRELVVQVVNPETGQIIDEILYEIRRGEERDARARLPVGGLARA